MMVKPCRVCADENSSDNGQLKSSQTDNQPINARRASLLLAKSVSQLTKLRLLKLSTAGFLKEGMTMVRHLLREG